MKIRIAIAQAAGHYCAHGFDGATDEQLSAVVRAKVVEDTIPVRFVEIEIPDAAPLDAPRRLHAV